MTEETANDTDKSAGPNLGDRLEKTAILLTVASCYTTEGPGCTLHSKTQVGDEEEEN